MSNNDNNKGSGFGWGVTGPGYDFNHDGRVSFLEQFPDPAFMDSDGRDEGATGARARKRGGEISSGEPPTGMSFFGWRFASFEGQSSGMLILRSFFSVVASVGGMVAAFNVLDGGGDKFLAALCCFAGVALSMFFLAVSGSSSR